MAIKLDEGQRILLSLILKGADAEGWAPVSASVYSPLSKVMPRELVELEVVGDDGRGRARLTEAGANVLAAMEWL